MCLCVCCSWQHTTPSAAGCPAPADQHWLPVLLGQPSHWSDDLRWSLRSLLLHGEWDLHQLQKHWSWASYIVLKIHVLFLRVTLVVLWSVRNLEPGLWLVLCPGEAQLALLPLLQSMPVSPSCVPGSTRPSLPTEHVTYERFQHQANPQ